jgi:hypothetical protein
MKLPILFAITAVCLSAQAPPCVVSSPRAEFQIRHVAGAPKLTLNENERVWKRAASQIMFKDCSRQIEYPESKTIIKAFWTEKDLYLLFRCPYAELNLFLPPDHTKPRVAFGIAT